MRMCIGLLLIGYNAAESEMEELLNKLDSMIDNEAEPVKESFWTKLRKRLPF